MTKALKFLIGCWLGAMILLFPLSQFQPDPLEPLQTLAVQLDGRKKPLDTVAKEAIAQIHGSTEYRQPNGEIADYFSTYLGLWFNDRNWNEEPFVLFSYRPLKQQIGVDPAQKYFSFKQLVSNASLVKLAQQAHQKELKDEDLSRTEREALMLEDRLTLMLQTVGDERLPLVPHPEAAKGTWVGLSSAQTLYAPEQVAPLLAEFIGLKQAFLTGSNHLAAVGQLAQTLHQNLAHLSPDVYPIKAVLQREVHFNHFHPFAKAWQLYAIAFTVMLLTLWLKQDLYWGAIGLFTTGIAVQSYGFWLRMQIAGRPPVTNMYESVVWVGFGIAALALAFELSTRARYYLLAAAPLSVLCLILADSLPAVLDPSIAPLVPVLRDNFWLSIHVPTIALSYASFALALGLGHVTLGNYLFTPEAKKRIQTLAQLNYRVLQVGVLLLTAGIILGGIWAHFSWGRFWGWDPKETWALIALLCYLAPLHGRLVGWIGNFGITVASVVAFNAVLMAWYGVNFVLGTGLHSYGFGTGGSELLVAGVVGLDLLFVAIAATRHYGWLKSHPVSSAAIASNQ
ncbi:MAG: cytochrome c biogenesis protein [Almyronema sp.]